MPATALQLFLNWCVWCESVGLIDEVQLSKYGTMVLFEEFIEFLVFFTNNAKYEVCSWLLESKEFCNLNYYTIESNGYEFHSIESDLNNDENGKSTTVYFLDDCFNDETLKDYYDCYWRLKDLFEVSELKQLGLDEDKYNFYEYIGSLSSREIAEILSENKHLKDSQFNTENRQYLASQQAIIEDLKSQLNQANAKIAELEQQADKPSGTPAKPMIGNEFDANNPYTYPPELDIAFKVWKEIYTTENIPRNLDTHNAKYIQALKNLGITFADNAPKERIKIITTPKQKKEKTKK